MSVESTFELAILTWELNGCKYLLKKWPENENESELILQQNSVEMQHNLIEEQEYSLEQQYSMKEAENLAEEQESGISNNNEYSLENTEENSFQEMLSNGENYFIREYQETYSNQLSTFNDTEENQQMIVQEQNNEVNAFELLYSDIQEMTRNTSGTYFIKVLYSNDIFEIVSAYKCKFCPYTTQDKSLLLQHFESCHVSKNISVTHETHHPTQQHLVQEQPTNEPQQGGLYYCSQCKVCYPTIEIWKEHMIKIHHSINTTLDKRKEIIGNENCVTDKTIDNTIKSEKSNFAHNKQNDNYKERYIKCKYRSCPYKFTSTEQMLLHAECHTEFEGTNYFKCSVCKDLKFAKWRPCSSHLWKDHQIGNNHYNIYFNLVP